MNMLIHRDDAVSELFGCSRGGLYMRDRPRTVIPLDDAVARVKAIPARRLKPLQWTDPAPPGQRSSYDNCTAPSVLGEFMIEWRSWKADGDGYCLSLGGAEFLGSYPDLPTAQNKAFEVLERRINEAFEEETPA
jgi:hypothetical protein